MRFAANLKVMTRDASEDSVIAELDLLLAPFGGTGAIGSAISTRLAGMGARVIVVDVVPEKLAHALSLGAEIAIDARDGDVAARIAEATGGGAHVSVEALGIEATTNGSIECLRPLGRHVQVGLPQLPSAPPPAAPPVAAAPAASPSAAAAAPARVAGVRPCWPWGWRARGGARTPPSRCAMARARPNCARWPRAGADAVTSCCWPSPRWARACHF